MIDWDLLDGTGKDQENMSPGLKTKKGFRYIHIYVNKT